MRIALRLEQPAPYSRIGSILRTGRNYRGEDVVASLEEAVKAYGCPRRIRLDNGPEFVSRDRELWAYANGVVLDFSRPGKPTDNAFIEAFNSRCRQECLNQHWFLSMQDAQAKLDGLRQHYNHARPHSSKINEGPTHRWMKEGAQVSSGPSCSIPVHQTLAAASTSCLPSRRTPMFLNP